MAADSGHFDTLEIETRGMTGARVYDSSGAPFRPDNETIVRERINLDPGDSDILRNEITTFDHAPTRPWSVVRSCRGSRGPIWHEYNCAVANEHIVIDHDDYLLSRWSADGGQEGAEAAGSALLQSAAAVAQAQTMLVISGRSRSRRCQ